MNTQKPREDLRITWRAGWAVIARGPGAWADDRGEKIVYRGDSSAACMAWIYRDHPTLGPMFARKAEATT